MMNFLGKTLVLVTLLFSVSFLAWSLAVWSNRVDWGWKDPRKHLEAERVPSEIDKRAAIFKQLIQVKAAVTRQVETTRQSLTFYEALLPYNHLIYAQELARLESAPGPITVQEIEVGKDGVVLDDYLRPRYGKKLTFTDADKKSIEISKSYASYRADLQKVQGDIDEVTAGIQKWVASQKDLTFKLNGTAENGNKTARPGLYRLLDQESQTQDRLRQEMIYVRPLWVRELVDAQLLLERQQSLRRRLAELKAVLAAGR